VKVLQGMRETIQQYQPVILCEVHELKEEIEQLLLDLFKPIGYQASQIDGSPLPEYPANYQLLLVPPDRIAPEAHEKRRAG